MVAFFKRLRKYLSINFLQTKPCKTKSNNDIEGNIDLKNLPEHICILLDGNGRWGEKMGKSRNFGHANAIESVRELIKTCLEFKIPFLTLYAFSTENWDRPKSEVDFLINLISKTIETELQKLLENNIRLTIIGDINKFPEDCQRMIRKAVEESVKCTGLRLVIALNYGGRWEISEAIKKIIPEIESGKLSLNQLNEGMFTQYLATKDIPDPSLLIRTGGELRISNFLLWQIAYTELYFSPVLWPDFKKKHLCEAIVDYQKRERRFGKVKQIVF